MNPLEESDQPKGSSSPPRRRWMARAVWALWVVGATLLVVQFVPAGSHRIGPGVVSIGTGPALRGETVLSLPPLGRVSANTHPSPVRLTAELRELDVQPVIAAGGRLDAETIEEEIRADLPPAITSALIRLLLAGAATGALAAAVAPRRRARSVLAGAVLGCLTVGATVGSVALGFDARRFEEPVYDGSLALGGPLLAAVTSGDASGLDARVDVLAERLAGLYSASVTATIAGSEGEVAILHVSDLHLNPVGVGLTRDLAESFGVDAILDTGDTTSFGLPIEEPFAALFDDFGVPYYFVAGNHDSPENREVIASAPGVTAIGGRVVDIGGVEVLGFDDPVVTTTRSVPAEERQLIMDRAAPRLRRLVEENSPDVVAMHNPAMASEVAGEVPLVVAGHLHRSIVSWDDGTIVSVVGSTGATGLGSLTVVADEPYVAQVLRFSGERLVAIDTIELIGTGGNFEVRRRLFEPGQEPTDSEPDPALSEDPEEPTLEDLEDRGDSPEPDVTGPGTGDTRPSAPGEGGSEGD